MPSAKKGSNRSQIRRSLRKLKKQTRELEKSDNPDRLSRRKPIFIKRNIYLAKKFKKRVKDHGIFCSCSMDPGSSTLCGSDCSCGILLSSCSSSCKCTSECTNKPFQQRRIKKIKLVQVGILQVGLLKMHFSSTLCGSDCSCGILLSSCSSSCKCTSECTNKPFQQRRIKKIKLVQTEKCGFGIAADEDIKPGEFIIEYVGEVIDGKICEERLWKLTHKVETNFYLCQINWNMVIDATHKGNKSRYINHSCSPNTEMQKWIIDGETRLGIFATRFINKGEQLTYDYQFVQFGADQDCYCGAVGCRKKLGVKARKIKKKTSEEAVKPVACKVTWKKPKVKTRGRRLAGQAWNNRIQRKICSWNCIGVVIWLARPMNQRCFGIITQYDEFSRKHLVMYEDGVTEIMDMSREVWKIVTL